jgi:signal transduction histidine kinase/DNA-directed RNA polymerase subunit N (RpoN/RPB10)
MDSTQQLKKQLKDLREEVQIRTSELEAKTRELTREAQIQLALERVRARTMAMQHSEELQETALLLFQQIEELGIPMFACGFNIWDDDKQAASAWMAGKDRIQLPFKTSSREDIFARIYKASQNGDSLFVEDQAGNNLEAHYTYMASIPTFNEIASKLAKTGQSLPSYQIMHCAYFSQGYLMVISLVPVPDDHDMFIRFAKVFEQTYTRFLDLQKAEAQSREAQIQLGLERVRARAMAMQKSEELNALIGTVFVELTRLDIQLTRCVIMINAPQTNATTWWMANSEAPDTPMNFFVQYHEHPPYLAYLEAWRERRLTWEYILEGTRKKEWDDFIFSETGLAKLPEFVIAGMRAPERVYLNASFNNFGNLTLATLKPLSDEHSDILLRFAKVFDVTYTRFNDLQQAEAQAREAQIQLAMERVRARTMAMRHSEELAETASLLFKQINDLGIYTWTSGFNIWEENYQSFIGYNPTPTGEIASPYHIPSTENIFFRNIYEAKTRGEDFFVFESGGQSLSDTYAYMKTLPIVQDVLKGIEDSGFTLPAFQVNHCAFFSKGFLLFITFENFPEAHQIFKRFAKVFEQTYTRFLDLQQAEAQAREAQIQLALERVRARTMAMQRSDELSEVANILFQQVKSLGVPQWTCGLNIWETGDEDFTYYPGNMDDKKLPPVKIPLREHPVFKRYEESRKRGDEFYVYEKSAELQADQYKYMLSVPGGLGEMMQGFLDAGLSFPTFQIDHVANFSHGSLLFITYEHVPQMHEIFKRFAKVFEQTYTRFLDLQKAEAQAREAKIEAALERIRSRTMAMQKSDELTEVAGLLFKQVTDMGINTWTAGFNVWSEDNNSYVDYITSPNGGFIEPYTVFTDRAEALMEISNARKSGIEFAVLHVEGEKLKKLYIALTGLGEEQFEKMRLDGAGFPSQQYEHFVFGFKVSLMFITYAPVPEAHDIFKRFGKVFEQTYTRFLDLKKAEAQAREAHIEAALEKVRSRTMAMQKSDELEEVIQVVCSQLVNLNMNVQHAGFIIDYKERDDMHIWLADEHAVPSEIVIPYFDSPHWNSFREAKAKGNDLFVNLLNFEEKNKFYQDLFTLFPIPTETREYYLNCPGLALSTVLLENIGLYIENFSGIPYSDEENKTLMRFGKVFQQTYTRFLDLQKAEAQAKEARIEAALERTRTQSMLMQHSDQLDETLRVFHEQVLLIGIPSAFSFLWLPDDQNDKHIFWAAWAERNSGDPSNAYKSKAINYPLDRNDPATAQCLIDWKSGQRVFSYHVPPTGVDAYFAAWKELLEGVEKLKPEFFQGGLYYVEAFMKYGCFGVMVQNEMPDDEKKILGRFAVEFERTYTRFLDLQKAEAQARESRIEAALEKVRGKAMAMHNSNDLALTASMVFTELRKLNIIPIRCGVGLLQKDSKKSQLYSTTSTAHHESLSLVGWVLLEKHPILTNIYDHWLRSEDYFPQLSGEEIKPYYQMILEGLPVTIPESTAGKMEYGSFIYISVGCLYTWSAQPYNETEIRILKRFAAIIDLTFRRYIELKKSEASATEAVKQAALGRIRADIASMRTVADLDRIIPLVWNELTILGVPFIRCGVFIMDEEKKLVHSFLSSPNGTAIAGFHIPYGNPGPMRPVIDQWRKKEIHTDYWDTDAFKAFAVGLVEQGVLTSAEQYLSTMPNHGLHLHFLPFLQGMLYVGNTNLLSEEDMTVVKLVAGAFSTAYARYEDFNKLEAAKEQVDKTLVKLRQTQQQLIQSEKMASLGELTAGIAHEIQNPLNFVNNFSDVNKELLAEMIEEIEKGNLEEVKALANDIEENERKINHHGKRADSIVKGMLQHSRSSSGQKETSNLNALAEEYLKLSYQAFRSKDKDFNTLMETQLDKTITSVQMVPQDIGRVLLNLYNNAFYAVNAKKIERGEVYTPKVEVSTRKLDGIIEISISDNGTGIPQKIIDRIYHPFFTTKPTGEGTGLGLSLSYDIIKAHGGEIKVQTVEGEGTQFFVLLPSSE